MAGNDESFTAGNDESLDSLLDSALEDFKATQSNRSAGQPGTSKEGLGKGLPSLKPIKKKSKAKSNESMTEALQKLAEQTKNAVQSVDSQPESDMLENMAKEFGNMDLDSFMGTLMEQILSKDILHEPMKEIGQRYPAWLEANRANLTNIEFDRYSKQHALIQELCRVYETTPDDFKKIMDLMQEMQSCGVPPSEIIEELAPGLQLGEDGLPQLPNFDFPPGVDRPPGAQGENPSCCIM